MTRSPADGGGAAGEPRFADLVCGPPPCGARTRAGGICRRPSVPGRSRCIAHGGAAAAGAPKGRQNALKHGAHTAAAKAERKALNAMIREGWRTVREIEKG